MVRRRKQFSPINKEINWELVLGPSLFGMDSEELAELTSALHQHSPRCIRLRESGSSCSLPFSVSSVPWYSRGKWVDDPSVRPSAFLPYAAGDYYIQDAASLLALALCDAKPGERVCDVCAAPGGKSTGLLEQLQGRGFLVSNEVIRSRCELLELSLCRSGWGNFITTQLDAASLASNLEPEFDCVLVDAPCSGQSLVGRNRQSMASFGSTQITHNALRQEKILRAASSIVRPGGRLVYSTCTFSIDENELRIEQFLNQNPQWQLLEIPSLSRWSSPWLPGCYRLWPHRDDCDGGFAAAMILTSDSRDSRQMELETVAVKPRWQDCHERSIQLDFVHPDILRIDGFIAKTDGTSIHLFESNISPELIRRSSSGLPIATHRSGRWEPCYGSAVSQHPYLASSQTVSLADESAIRFIAGESVPLSSKRDVANWCRVQWEDKPLSWGKQIGVTLKNHFPKLLRLTIN